MLRTEWRRSPYMTAGAGWLGAQCGPREDPFRDPIQVYGGNAVLAGFDSWAAPKSFLLYGFWRSNYYGGVTIMAE